MTRPVFRLSGLVAGILALLSGSATAADLSEITVDWATYNPVSILLKNEKLLEKEFEKDGITVKWVQSAGSNKALEFLNARSIDFGASAGGAALVARINGNPIRSVGVYSLAEWTALVVPEGSPITKVEDLKGKRIAVTRGTDPHIFLERALADAGLSDKDVTLVLLQHADGKQALLRGDVDAWAGLDPLMASAELENKAVLLFRKPEYNSGGVISVPEDFATEHPDIVRRVLGAYEAARKDALARPDALKEALVAATKLPPDVIERQLERTRLTTTSIEPTERKAIVEAGLALQKVGLVTADIDIAAVTDQLIDRSFAPPSQ
ncbi:ABC transporter substrate-binding protein [Aureimonas endophytica]|uniref:Putative aliphatic sulfonates-binding protein n=1 Tax=Aureimonas endophytica TaxID=2027858 RepID=A0A916ZLJ9_9HYPH|nr:aliphatic sulfonate ABC transporter substrate-binding protein [Aureimonas endophytica]GGE03371.1 ABC transporter substrate-binding protein [Aureimonas endophytica]